MINFKQALNEKRPNLSQSSLDKYDSTLRTLFKNVFKSKDYDIAKLKETDKILESLKTVPADKRKTILSALFVLTGIPEYKEQMISDIDTYNEETSTHQMNQKTEDNWITKADIETKLNELSKSASIIYKLDNPTFKQLRIIQLYVLLALQGGVYIAPRRCADWCFFKIGDINKQINNYVSGNVLVFNSYKTAKSHGQETITIPTELKAILTKYIRYIKPLNDNLFFNNKGLAISSTTITLMLNSIFGKHVGVNILRKVYLTTKYGGMLKQQADLAQDMKNMGSSGSQVNHYLLQK